MITERDLKFKHAKTVKTDQILWGEYKTLCNKALTMIRNDETNYKVDQMKGKNNWKMAKKLLNINQPQAPSIDTAGWTPVAPLTPYQHLVIYL